MKDYIADFGVRQTKGFKKINLHEEFWGKVGYGCTKAWGFNRNFDMQNSLIVHAI